MAFFIFYNLLQSSTNLYFVKIYLKKSTKIYNFGLFSTNFYTLNN